MPHQGYTHAIQGWTPTWTMWGRRLGAGVWQCGCCGRHSAADAASIGTRPSAARSQARQEASCGMSPRVRNMSATYFGATTIACFKVAMHVRSGSLLFLLSY